VADAYRLLDISAAGEYTIDVLQRVADGRLFYIAVGEGEAVVYADLTAAAIHPLSKSEGLSTMDRDLYEAYTFENDPRAAAVLDTI
jgi:hypothetical protein